MAKFMKLKWSVVDRKINKVLIVVSALFFFQTNSLTAQKVQLFDFVLIDSVVINKLKNNDKLYPYAITPNGEFVQYSTDTRSLKFEGNDTHVISRFLDTLYKWYYPSIDGFSFVNDSVIFIIYQNAYFTWQDDAIVLYNLKSRKTSTPFNLEKTGIINMDDYPLDIYNTLDKNLYNVPWEYLPFKHYNSSNNSFIMTVSGMHQPFDGIYPTAKPNLLNLQYKPRKSYYADFAFEQFNPNYIGFKFDRKMDNMFNYVPKMTRMDDSLILISYKMSHDLIVYNTNSNKYRVMEFKKDILGMKNNSFAKPTDNIIHDSLAYQIITYNDINKWITRKMYSPVSNVNHGSLIIKNRDLNILIDSSGTPIALQNINSNYTNIEYCEKGVYYGYIEIRDSAFVMGKFRIKLLDSFIDIKISNINEPNYVNVSKILKKRKLEDTISVLKYNFGCGVCTKNLLNFYRSELKSRKNKPYIVLVKNTLDSLDLINRVPKNKRNGLNIVTLENEYIKNRIPTSNGYFIKKGSHYEFETSNEYKELFYHINTKFNYREFCMIVD